MFTAGEDGIYVQLNYALPCSSYCPERWRKLIHIRSYEDADIILDKILYHYLPFECIVATLSTIPIFRYYCNKKIRIKLSDSEASLNFEYKEKKYAIVLHPEELPKDTTPINLANCRAVDGAFVILADLI